MLHSEELLLRVVLGLYVFAVVGYLLRFVARWSWAGRLATGLAALGLLAHTAMLVLRGVTAGHIPLVSMYEYLSAFAWMVVLAYLVWELRARANDWAQAAGAPALLLALFLLGYAASLPADLKQAEELVPVLRSNWLIFHVSVAVVGYGAAGLACALSCLYFLSHKLRKSSRWLAARIPPAPVLDRAAYQAVRFAFPFLTLVNVTGAIWAYSSWGRYWGWDPKESWSLITWLVFTFYLHARVRAGWRPAQTNAIVVVGMLTILFTFLGVNQLAAFSSSLHSYASSGS